MGKYRDNSKRLVIYRGFADLKKRNALENKLYKMDFKSITEALRYAYDNPEKVDYDCMRSFISRQKHTFVWKDTDLELIKAANEIFISNPESTIEDIKFIDTVLHDHIGKVISNYIEEFKDGRNLTEFGICKNYEAVRILSGALRVNPNLLPIMQMKDFNNKTGIEWLNKLQSMIEKDFPGLSKHYLEILKYRHREDGTLQTFDEQMLNIVTSEDYTFDDKYLRRMIKTDGTFLQGRGLAVLGDITRYRIMARSGNNVYGKADFINGVYKDNIGALLDIYEQQLLNGESLDKKQLVNDYGIVKKILESYEKPNSNEMMFDGLELGLYDSDDKTRKRPIDRIKEIKETIEKEYGITSEYELNDDGKKKKGIKGFYEQMKKIKVGIVDKKNAERIEQSMMDKKQEIGHSK